ncbi:hypothetical protein BS78_06G111800 [Paspalum vaginatum]|nr:hypothetical protein BS78_06G111800 [Paspalum vaginatum]
MDHVMNYAFQACSSNEEWQSLEATTNASAAQQWMHSNSQFNMHEQYPPYFSTTHSPLRPSSQLPMQQITEEPGAMVGASTGNKSCKVKLKNFSSDEDVNLTKWWLAISTDPVVNTGQRKEGFWSRITKGYNSTLGVYPERSHKSLMNRWDHIKESCTKFGDIYAAILRANPSGMSDADKTTEAVARFADTQSKPFNLMHCWKYLKDEPKWQETICDQSKPIDVEDDCYVTPAGGPNQVDIDGEGSTPCSGGRKRPLGWDSTKESRKKSASSSES